MNIQEKLESLAEIAKEKVKNLNVIELGFEEYSNLWNKAWEEYTKLNKEYKLEKEYTLKSIPSYGDLLTMEEFISCVKSGGFIDSDGSGNYATKDQMSDITIRPSEIRSGVYRKDFTHVVWFNK